MTDEELAFQKYFPQITELTIVDAAKSFGAGDEIISLNGNRSGLDAFVLMLATDCEIKGPFVLTSVCARHLCQTLISEGFGPSK